jgi:hypothetical protein
MADIQFILTPVVPVEFILLPVPIVDMEFNPTTMIGPYETIIHVVEVEPSTLVEGDFYIILNN